MRQQTRQVKNRAVRSPKKKSETRLKGHATRVVPISLETTLADARRITEELFPGEITIETDFDPEYPTGQFVVFNVRATGGTKELLDRQCEWHRRVAAVMPSHADRSISISIDPIQ